MQNKQRIKKFKWSQKDNPPWLLSQNKYSIIFSPGMSTLFGVH